MGVRVGVAGNGDMQAEKRDWNAPPTLNGDMQAAKRD